MLTVGHICVSEQPKNHSLIMPGMVAFGRRWGIASDDLVLPGAFELFLRVLWFVKDTPSV